MRVINRVLMTVAVCATAISCSNHNHRAADTPAGKVGQVAYDAAKVTGKAAKAASHGLEKAAHDARAGWKEAAAKDKGK